MSIFEDLEILAPGEGKTEDIGASLAGSLYTLPLTIALTGELGAGKTTFVRGLARSFGPQSRVTSPTFTLEQRYSEKLLHIDLYRLSAQEAEKLLEASQEFTGVRVVEWAERAPLSLSVEPHIAVALNVQSTTERLLRFDLKDLPIPSEGEIQAMLADVLLPVHIVRHMETVALVAATCAEHLLQRGVFVRRKALVAAARVHDLLRFVDFSRVEDHRNPSPTHLQIQRWAELKDRYGAAHELAASRYLADRGLGAIGQIVLTHGVPRLEHSLARTTEQRILAYSDKRALFDRIVSIDERFDNFAARYGNGEESPFARQWRADTKQLERELFPEGPPL